MECRVRPYEGPEARAAFIHAGDDDKVIFPFIERLHRSGLRIWHDSDARKKMVDYTSTWNTQQAACSAYIVFLSENAVNSHIFRERFTNAIESKKPVIVISTVGQELLSPGMKLQIEKASAVMQSSYIPKENLSQEIAGLASLKECIGVPDYAEEVSAYPDLDTRTAETPVLKKERNIAPSDRTYLELHGTGMMNTSVPQEKKEEPQPVLALEQTEEIALEKADMVSPLDETIRLKPNTSEKAEDLEATIIPQRAELPVIVSLVSGEKKKGILGEAVVGRTKKIQGAAADLSFTDDCRLFSGKHFLLIYIDGKCILVCKHPNGMNVNGQEMQEGDRYAVDSAAFIQIPSNAVISQLDKQDTRLSYLIVGAKKQAKKLWSAKAAAFLQAKETGEIQYFTDRFIFGRGNAWKTGVMTSRSISRDHGEITLDAGRYLFVDHSTNGTQINGTQINHESMELKDNDIISVQGDEQSEEVFIFHCCYFERG